MNAAKNLIMRGQYAEWCSKFVIHVSMFVTNIAPKKLNRVANMLSSVRW